MTAPDGYEVAEDVKFTVAETGDNLNPLIWLLLLGLGGGLAGAAWYLRKKDNEGQSRD